MTTEKEGNETGLDAIAAAVAATAENASSLDVIPDGDEQPPADGDIPAKEGEVVGGEEDKPGNDEVPDEPPVDRTNPHVTLEREVYEPVTEKHRKSIPVAIIPRTLKEFARVNDTAGNLAEELGATPNGQEWLYHLLQGQRLYAAGGVFVDSTTREDSDWGQMIDYNGTRLVAGAPAIGGGGQKLSGNKAAMAMRSGMGMASAITTPLWHSGIWLTTSAPMDSELLVLLHQLMNERIELGNQTAGLVFSNSSVLAAEKVTDFILSRVYGQSCAESDPDELKKLIKVTDFQTMVWGMALTIYPHGFTHRRPCIDNPHKCTHVSEYHLNLSRLLLVDRAAIPLENRRHMAARKANHNTDTIKEYQEKGRAGVTRTRPINPQLSVTFRTPSLHDWFESGKRWIRNIEEVIDKGFGSNLTVKQKNDLYAEQSIVSFLRQYAHWVGSINYNDVEYDDVETIDALISAMSEDDTSVTNFLEEVKSFIDYVTIALIAIPTHDCPACGKPQSIAEQPHPEVIPLDALQVFFTLADHRTLRAKAATTKN